MANTQSTQIKVTLPQELYLMVKANADKIGLNLAAYIRHLTINDSWEKNLPTFPMSTKTEARGQKALKEYEAGKTIKVEDIDKFFKNL
jgi:hypothetical protein